MYEELSEKSNNIYLNLYKFKYSYDEKKVSIIVKLLLIQYLLRKKLKKNELLRINNFIEKKNELKCFIKYLFAIIIHLTIFL